MAKRWYIVHAYSNFENKVAESIREQAKQRGLEELFEQIMVPKEKVTEVRRGRKPGTHVLTLRDGTCGVPTLLLQPSPARDDV